VFFFTQAQFFSGFPLYIQFASLQEHMPQAFLQLWNTNALTVPSYFQQRLAAFLPAQAQSLESFLLNKYEELSKQVGLDVG